MESCSASGLVFVCLPFPPLPLLLLCYLNRIKSINGKRKKEFLMDLCVCIGQLDREGNARKVVNCSCVVVRDWGEESQERSILLNYFQTEQ